jgi:ABC-2 type transport system ATP-binding protein
MIQVQDFHKSYGDFVAVQELTFIVRPGQVMGLVGPNGAGKTTTLRALAGLCGPSRGQLTVAGYDTVHQAVDVKKRLAYVADDPQLFADLTVNEHLRFFAAAYHVPDALQRAERLLIDFQLESKQDTLARNLSRGMRQKLAICCAYLYEPLVLLFDEPMTGLDPLGIRQFKESVRERAEQGATIVVSSHLLAVVEDICSHVLILKSGRMQYHGTLEEVRTSLGTSGQVRSLEEIFFLATGANEPLSELSI